MTYAILVHGGAGPWRGRNLPRALRGIREALQAGRDVLAIQGTALDAVQAAVEAMEDNPVFNAGTGASLNLLGRVEVDAAIMDGATLEAGAVTLLSSIRYPVRLARLVMERTDHVLLAGRGAESLGRAFHLEKRNLVTGARRRAWKKTKATIIKGKDPNLPKMAFLQRYFENQTTDTVGALALDDNGNLAAASSTGGYAFKLPGRIGDTPLIGAGLYADNGTGCATVTGRGEGAIRLVLSKTVADLIPEMGPQKASERGIKLINSRVPVRMGTIALDRKGRIGAAHNTPAMPWGSFSTKTGKMVVKPRAVFVRR